MKKFVYPLMGALLLGVFGCSEDRDVAGGVSEETNTVAGILTGIDGVPVKGMAVSARHASIDTLVFTDTTTEKGEFAFPILRQGVYGLSASADSVALYNTFTYEGKPLDIEASLRKTGNVKSRIVLNDDADIFGAEIYIPGSSWKAISDSNGSFSLEHVPLGDYSVMVKSPDPVRYLDAQFALGLKKDGFSLKGPVPAEMDVASLEIDGDSVAALPLSAEYGLLSWWPMDYVSSQMGDTVTTDARGRVGSSKLYGGAELSKGLSGKSVHFVGAGQFGVIEEDRGILDSLTEMTLEILVKFDSISPKKGTYQKNVMGKLGFGSEEDRDVFSLALVNGICGAEKPSLAFFMADGSGEAFECDNAVVSKADLVEKEWMHVVVTWKDGSIRIYQNSELTGSKDIGVKMLMPSDEPIFFGKEELDFELDDVRLGARAITSADVLYRYYQKTGGKL